MISRYFLYRHDHRLEIIPQEVSDLIQIDNLTKRYGKHFAVDNLNFTVNKGEIFGLLGPNGAGKSTTMNIICGYLSATEGSVLIGGLDVLDHPLEVKKKIGYMPESPPLYFDMTVLDYLNFVGQIKKLTRVQIQQGIEKSLDLCKIRNVSKRLIKNLSKGYKQRVGLAQAILGDPEVLILDEPSIGLDPKQIIEMRTLIKDLGKDHTIILSSHILPEVSAVCQRVMIINEGKKAASDTPENLSKRLMGTSSLLLRVDGEKDKIKMALNNIQGTKKIQFQESPEPNTINITIEADKTTDIRRQVFHALSKANCPILQMRNLDMTLEDIFLHLITKEKEVSN